MAALFLIILQPKCFSSDAKKMDLRVLFLLNLLVSSYGQEPATNYRRHIKSTKTGLPAIP